MAKYQLLIEADSFTGLMENVKQELQILSEEEEKAKEAEKIINKKVKLKFRTKKKWTEFEDDFLIENYRYKNFNWIAEKLNRSKSSISQRLNKIRKTTNLPLKINKTINL